MTISKELIETVAEAMHNCAVEKGFTRQKISWKNFDGKFQTRAMAEACIKAYELYVQEHNQ